MAGGLLRLDRYLNASNDCQGPIARPVSDELVVTANVRSVQAQMFLFNGCVSVPHAGRRGTLPGGSSP
jgi:hypothetical protein